MRTIPLTTAKDGMTRLRHKGGASPDTLYDLLNGYITLAGTIRPRPGTQTDITLPADTVGLVAHKCRLYTFNHEPAVTSNPDKYVVAVLRHPTDPTIVLEKIHFASPFMGFLYVAAEFADGNVWHYWLEELDAWSPNTDYKEGDRVVPTTENGFAYRARRTGSPYPAWAPNEERTVGDIVEPTVANGYKYEIVATTGSSPTTGEFEPDWPEESGAQVTEYTHGSDSASATTSTISPDIYSGAGFIYPGYDPDLLAGGFRSGVYTRNP